MWTKGKVLHLVCQWCAETKKKKQLEDCYFCKIDLEGFNCHQKKKA